MGTGTGYERGKGVKTKGKVVTGRGMGSIKGVRPEGARA